MMSLWLPDFILITTHTNINIISIGPNIGPKNVEVLALNNPLFFYSFFLHSLSLFCSDAFFLNCRPRHDPLSSKRQDRERRGGGGWEYHPRPSPHTSTPAPPASGENKRRRRRGCGTQLFILLFSRLKVYICIYIYYTYVHMMKK